MSPSGVVITCRIYNHLLGFIVIPDVFTLVCFLLLLYMEGGVTGLKQSVECAGKVSQVLCPAFVSVFHLSPFRQVCYSA